MKRNKYKYDKPKDKRTNKKNRNRKEHADEIILVRRIRCFRNKNS